MPLQARSPSGASLTGPSPLSTAPNPLRSASVYRPWTDGKGIVRDGPGPWPMRFASWDGCCTSRYAVVSMGVIKWIDRKMHILQVHGPPHRTFAPFPCPLCLGRHARWGTVHLRPCVQR